MTPRDHIIEGLAIKIWSIVEPHPEFYDDGFTDENWRKFLTEPERERYREVARQAISAIDAREDSARVPEQRNP